MKPSEIISAVNEGRFDESFKSVYISDEALDYQKPRYIRILKRFIELFGDERDVMLLSAPGRTEICGNHTDHNNGKVLAAAINLDAIAVAAKSGGNTVREKSEGHGLNSIDISNLEPSASGYGKSSSMIKGVIASLHGRGYNIGAFDACTASDVMGGSGLSSSAAFEVLIGTIVSYLFNDGKIDAVTIAKASQYSENVFFGKPSGLLDQMASSVGTFVTIDFESTKNPLIRKIDYDFLKSGHSLCIVDTHGSHSDLTDDYAAVRGEMEAVAKAMGEKVLRRVDENKFYAHIPKLLGKVSDRAILRACHFFNENKRVDNAIAALENNDFEQFKNVVISSGMSSFLYNQNVYSTKSPNEQKLSLALCISQQILEGRGAWRVHGGGFAGTIQAFVPNDMLDEYRLAMESVFGKDSCYVLTIRPIGGTRIL